jgi:hypothetical protein
LRRTHPAITVISREGSTPALARALRAGIEAPARPDAIEQCRELDASSGLRKELAEADLTRDSLRRVTTWA